MNQEYNNILLYNRYINYNWESHMKQSEIQYNRIRVTNPENEIKMISILRGIGQPFKAISTTDYIISTKQCAVLEKNKIDYEILK